MNITEIKKLIRKIISETNPVIQEATDSKFRQDTDILIDKVRKIKDKYFSPNMVGNDDVDIDGQLGDYTVSKGDNLTKIAKRHNVSLSDLLKSNPQIKDPDLIYTGDKINIPGTSKNKEKKKDSKKQNTSDSAFENKNILIVGDSTALGLVRELPAKYRGASSKVALGRENLPSHKIMNTAIGGARSGQILNQLEKRIESLQIELDHEDKKDKLMIISLGGNDSRWYELQNTHPRYKKQRKENGPQTGNDNTFHTAKFTYTNIMNIAKLGESYGYEIRIMDMRKRKAVSSKADKNYQEEHRVEVNKLLNGSGYKVVSGVLGADYLGGGADYVHARKGGSAILLKRAAGGSDKSSKPEKEKEPPEEQTTSSVNVPYDLVQRRLGLSQSVWDLYRDVLGNRESGNRYNIQGGGGNNYDGRWQLGRLAKLDAGRILGIWDPSDKEIRRKVRSEKFRKQFRSDPQMQEDFLAGITIANDKYMNKNKIYRNASPLERLKILAHAHLVGHAPTKKWLNSGKKGIYKDGFGTKASSYYVMIDDALKDRGLV